MGRASNSPMWPGTLVVIFALIAPARVLAFAGDHDKRFGASASIRHVATVSINDDNPIFGRRANGEPNRSDAFSQTILRLVLAGRPTDWLAFEVHGVNQILVDTASAAVGQKLFAVPTPSIYRLSDADWNWLTQGDVEGNLFLDRFNLKFRLPWCDLTVGRQAITFSTAHFWNPLDVFLAFDPRQFDRDYKGGVDALRIDLSFGDFSGLTLVGAAGKSFAKNTFEASWYGSALLARIFTNLSDWDISVQGGKVFGGIHFGVATAGEIGPFGLSAEGAYFLAMEQDPLPNHASATIGLSYRFDFDLLVAFDYLYNGSGDPNNLAVALSRVRSGRSFHASRHLSGLLLSYEILPILRGSLGTILSFDDASLLLQPGLVLSVSNESELLFGALFNIGEKPTGDVLTELTLESEFGTFPQVVYLEFKLYF